MFSDGYGFMSDSSANLQGSSAIHAAVLWVQAVLLGPMAVTVAVIAVASVGWMMLGGHIRVRRGMTVIGGCFILFGAPTIAAGIQSSVGGGVTIADVPAAGAPPSIGPPPTLPAIPPAADPYAGASVPAR